MIVEVLANSGEINNDRDVDAGEKSRVTNTRDLEDLRSMDGSSRKDDFLLRLDGILSAALVLRELQELVSHEHFFRRATAYLDTSSLHGTSVLASKNASNLVAWKKLEVLALRDSAVVVLCRGANNGLWVEVVRAEVSSNRAAIGLVEGNADAELPSGLDKILWSLSVLVRLESRTRARCTYSSWARRKASSWCE